MWLTTAFPLRVHVVKDVMAQIVCWYVACIERVHRVDGLAELVLAKKAWTVGVRRHGLRATARAVSQVRLARTAVSIGGYYHSCFVARPGRGCLHHCTSR